MNTNPKTEMALQLADVMAEAVRDVVGEIERSIPTTRGHYAEYMNMLDMMVMSLKLEKPSDNAWLIAGLALVKAGANRQGVKDALKVLGKVSIGGMR